MIQGNPKSLCIIILLLVSATAAAEDNDAFTLSCGGQVTSIDYSQMVLDVNRLDDRTYGVSHFTTDQIKDAIAVAAADGKLCTSTIASTGKDGKNEAEGAPLRGTALTNLVAKVALYRRADYSEPVFRAGLVEANSQLGNSLLLNPNPVLSLGPVRSRDWVVEPPSTEQSALGVTPKALPENPVAPSTATQSTSNSADAKEKVCLRCPESRPYCCQD